MDVAPSERYVFGSKRRDEAVRDVGNIAPPFLLTTAIQSRFAE
jgi:hypothetical protein